MNIEAIIGKTITAIEVHAESEFLTIETTDGEVCYQAEGDCCAHAWVEAINVLAELPAVLTGQEERRDMDTVEDDPEHEVLDVGFYSLRTDRGHVDIELRMSHNGYHGGCLTLLTSRDLRWCEWYRLRGET